MGVPNAATPSIDPIQGGLARLGLNGIEQNTSDASGRAGAAALTAIWSAAADKLKEKMRDVSEAVDQQFGPQIETIKSAVDGVGEWMKDRGGVGGGLSRKEEATLDASYAQQRFGGQREEVELLRDIAKSNRKISEKHFGLWGVPG
jgi:hypothetical protein